MSRCSRLSSTPRHGASLGRKPNQSFRLQWGILRAGDGGRGFQSVWALTRRNFIFVFCWQTTEAGDMGCFPSFLTPGWLLYKVPPGTKSNNTATRAADPRKMTLAFKKFSTDISKLKNIRWFVRDPLTSLPRQKRTGSYPYRGLRPVSCYGSLLVCQEWIQVFLSFGFFT